jgi:hypothetical protein
MKKRKKIKGRHTLRAVGITLVLSLPNVAFSQPFLTFLTDSASQNAGVKSLFRKVCSQLERGCAKAQPFNLARISFVKAHPEANLDSEQTKVRRALPELRLVAPVQSQLEAVAQEEALIFDCKPVKGGVSNCGVYLYDRDKKSVVSSSVRYFSLPVANPSAWSEKLASTFENGLSARRRLLENRAVEEFYARNGFEEDTDTARYGLGIRLGSQLGTKSAFQQLPKGLVSLGRTYWGHLFSVYFEGGKASNSNKNNTYNIATYGGGLDLSLRAEAMEITMWELGLQAGWEKTQVKSDNKTSSAQSLLFGIRPGVFFSLGKNFQMGPQFTWHYRTPLKESTAPSHKVGKLSQGFSYQPSLKFEFLY